jgi:lipopolysaccharide biosynthesis glycosyltransferase
MRKAREMTMRARASVEAMLDGIELARREEEELSLSGVTLSGIVIIGGQGSSYMESGSNYSNMSAMDNAAALAARRVKEAEKERKRQEELAFEQELQALEQRAAAQEAANEAAHEAAAMPNLGKEDEDDMNERMDRMEKEAGQTIGTSTDGKPHVFVRDNEGTNKSNGIGNVLVVIISNRRDGIIPTVASILTTSTLPVDVILIGEHEINEQVRKHFGNRINEFISMSVKDIEDDLVAQGYKPIWTWPEWHTSMDPSWRNENTLHVGSWDNLMTHAHVLNHIRFYLPLCTIFKGRPYFYFLDDVILVQRDLGELADRTMNDLEKYNGLVCACNIWMWNSQCFHFEFQSKKDYILSMPSLYGDREVCKTDSESHCVPANYWDFVQSQMPEGGDKQFAWNFGFSLFAIDNWVDLKLTEKYESVMKQSYELHVFPETSLTFGLGVAYIAFAGAVECWNEDYVQVRDGFGFIEWDRYAKTFGDDFFNHVDVVHYTGPDKPWVHESRIEQRAIVPWLKMMEQESMPVPKQLPLEATGNLFTLLAGDRSGAQWVMGMLDGHPQVCASGEGDKPETGFPADVLLPSGLPWYPYCSIKRGCSLEFMKKNVHELISNMTGPVPDRCLDSYDPVISNEILGDHLPRVCTFVKRLGGNYSDGSIAKVWVDGFINEDKEIVGCGCVRGVKAKGLKVMAEWLTYKGYPGEQIDPPLIDLNQTRVVGSKIIRLKRRNLWARYKSMMMAQQTEMYHPMNYAEKGSQIELLQPMDIDVHHMEWNIRNFEAIDRAGDEWAKEYGSEILWLYYEDCRLDTPGCFQKIYEFIGVDPSFVTGKKKALYESTFSAYHEKDSTLDHITNRGQIKEALIGNGWGHFISGESHHPMQLLVYHTDEMYFRTFQYLDQKIGLNTTLFGNDPKAEGYGNKFKVVHPILKEMSPDTMVVLSDDRDVWTNFPLGERNATFNALRLFREKFEGLIKGFPGAIVSSAELECCPIALTHASPGDFIDVNGLRKQRACSSGEANCQWRSDVKARQWMSFMQALAGKRGNTYSRRTYIEGSLLVGYAKDLVALVEKLDVGDTEDDRAVLADYMYRYPEKLLLDYN